MRKRELFGLILLALLKNRWDDAEIWHVGYDSGDVEPNDGFISNGSSKLSVEQKLVPQKLVPKMADDPVLSAILSTYEKYEKLGSSYGRGRILTIFANKASAGLVKISSLRDKIGTESPFDKVLAICCAKTEDGGNVVILKVTEHFPELGLAKIRFDLTTGSAEVFPGNMSPF